MCHPYNQVQYGAIFVKTFVNKMLRVIYKYGAILYLTLIETVIKDNLVLSGILARLKHMTRNIV